MTAQPAVRRAAAWRKLKEVQAALELQRMLAWVAESPAIAITTGVLTEALPALAAVARADAESSQQLAIKGGLHEWAPVAEILRRRLPRRMAAHLLPMVEAVTAAVAGSPAAGKKNAMAAANAAMAALLLVAPIACLSSVMLRRSPARRLGSKSQLTFVSVLPVLQVEC